MGKRKRALSTAVVAVLSNARGANQLIRTALARAASSAVVEAVRQQRAAIGVAVAKDVAAQRAADGVVGNAVRRAQQLAQVAAQAAAAAAAADAVVANAVAQRAVIQQTALEAPLVAAQSQWATGPEGRSLGGANGIRVTCRDWWRRRVSSGVARGKKPWDPEQLDVVLQFVKDNADATQLHITPLMLKLGYGGVGDPDTYAYLYNRVHFKCTEMRNLMRFGLDPLAPPRVQPNIYLYPLATKVRQVLRALPHQQVTAEDVCNAVLADDAYAATLDWRPIECRKDVPRWKKRVQKAMTRIPGTINTGAKRGRLIVYRYDPDADMVPTRDAPQPSAERGSLS